MSIIIGTEVVAETAEVAGLSGDVIIPALNPFDR